MPYSLPNVPELTALRTQLDSRKVPRCTDLDKAIDAHNVIQASMTAPVPLPERVADQTPADLVDLMTAMATRHNSASIAAAGGQLQAALALEARAALVAHMPAILKALRPAFDKAAKAVHAATELGIRPNMTAEDIIDLDSPEAIAAWRGLKEHLNTLSDIGLIRIRLSKMLQIAPQITDSQAAVGETVDFTACFVDPSTGLRSGYGSGTSQWRWLSLAMATNGKLRLNDTAEVEQILHGDGESPGWIVCAASAVVSDDDGRRLMLYRHQWIPSWLDQTQLDSLIDAGFVVAARPALTRPADIYPHMSTR